MPVEHNNEVSSSGGRDGFLAMSQDGKLEKPKNIFDIISEIQQLSVLESKAQNQIHKDFFTFRQRIDFFFVSFKTGIYEGIFFMFFFPVLLTITPAFMMYFYNYTFSPLAIITLNFFSYFSLGIMTILLLSFSKYYNSGALTRVAIDFVFFGRGTALIIKAIISFYLFKYLYALAYAKPRLIYEACNFFDVFTYGLNFVLGLFGIFVDKNNFSQIQYYNFFYSSLAPILKKTGNEMFWSLLAAGLSPYIAMIILRIYGTRGEKNQKKFDNY
jgi:hypothetical protein